MLIVIFLVKTNVLYRKTDIQTKLQQIEYNLSKHQSQLSSKFNLQNETYVKDSIDIVMKTFTIILQNDLNPFHLHFEQKKLLVHFNFHDAYLVKSFYDLDPTEEQVRISFTSISCSMLYFIFYLRFILFNKFGEQN